MGFFKKKSPGVVDLSDMQKRGLLNSVPEKNADEIIDYSKREGSVENISQTQENNFLSNLAGANTDSSTQNFPSPGPVTSSLRAARRSGQLDQQVSELKIKLEDAEYKIGSLTEKIKELELRLRDKGI